MDFFEVIEKRRSVRVFQEREVEEEKVQVIIESIAEAPSAGNLQAFEVVLVKERETKRKLAEAAFGQGFVEEAPIVLVFYANKTRSTQRYGERGKNLYALQDATIACVFAQLSATALGLSSVWVGAFEEKKVVEALGGSEELVPVAILPIGYAAEAPEKRMRRSVSDFVHKEKIE
jgi:nitroreductase